MLAKLIKYEFKAVSKLLIILHIALLVTTFFERILIGLNIFKMLPALGYVFSGIYVLSLITVSITTFIFLIYRFYRNLFSDEGYLMHTLPVTANQLILSKLIVGFCWCVIDAIIFCGSILILIFSKISSSEVANWYDDMRYSFETQIHINPMTFFIVIGVYALLTCFYSLLRFYSSIAIGHTFGKHKLLGAFAAYLVIYIIIEVISTVALFAFGILSMGLNTLDETYHFFLYAFSIGYGVTIIFSVVLYFITHYILKKKLNLE